MMIDEPKNRRWYLAGPMTGIPQFNIPLFDAAAEALRTAGYDVVSPAELDGDEVRAVAMQSADGAPGSGTANGLTWGDFLARDVKIVSDEVTGVIFLPGWERSRGARLEAFVALLCPGHAFMELNRYHDEFVLAPMSREHVVHEVFVNVG